MRIGVIREIKDQEYRVALTPDGARQLIERGHEVHVETRAGEGAGFPDYQYIAAGAAVVTADVAWNADLVLKVKEPLETEYRYFSGQTLFTFLHLAGVTPSLTEALLERRVTAIAYETIEDGNGRFPLLAPMSAIAGNMAAAIGNYYLAKVHGGKGTQLGMVLGERHGKVLVIGTGVVGQHAARTADGLGAAVFVFSRSERKYQQWRDTLSQRARFVTSNPDNIAGHIRDADLVIGAVLVPGARTPHVVSEAMVRTMEPGSVIVDVSIDQGGCIATAKPTSHSNPVYVRHGVLHYCVSNMPGAYPRTSTIALTGATLPYILRLADRGLAALRDDPGFAKGINIHQGYVTCRPVADALRLEARYKPFDAVG